MLTDEELERFFREINNYRVLGLAAPTVHILDTIIKERNKLQNGKGQ